MPSTNDIRSAFLGYFERNQHLLVPSAPLTPKDDPTLLFINAGMAPLKDYFSGARKPPQPRMASSQKCVRAGGKHNDLDNVGYTARHHTFFEMLGNFSFGDYFKEAAIEYAWTFLTRELALPAEKLLVTVFHEDEEAASLWRRIAGLGDDRIIRISTDDNFWSMGDTGPCGPCSEIFFDHGPGVTGGPPGSPDEDGDRFVEIWNLVFMQFDKQTDGAMNPLPKPCIDTGSGLERLAAALQGVTSNFDIDLFQHLIEASKAVSGVRDPAMEASHRVIADHLRTCAFLVAEGVLPGNEGRGYVLRRIMRRALRHQHLLGMEQLRFHELVQPLVEVMGDHYQELRAEAPRIVQAFSQEQEQFQATLGRGMRILEQEVADLQSRRGTRFSGSVAFKLYDTYGFPLDLTEDVLRGYGLAVDTETFDQEMAAQKARARSAWSGSGDAKLAAIWNEVADQAGASRFDGYDQLDIDARITALVVDGQPVERAAAGSEIAVICDQTVFYGESGGQVGDRGVMTTAAGARLTVRDTQKPVAGMHVHIGHLEVGELALGERVHQQVDEQARRLAAANHSATHLLHAALRNVLGDHVQQKGSYVGPDRLRFDFAHGKPVSRADLDRIEALVNAQVTENSETRTEEMALDAALKTGAMAQFDETYGDDVRVLFMGRPGPEGRPFSIELCGGTHVGRMGDIGLFKIVSESSVGAGIRRIEAVTNQAALDYTRETQELLTQLQQTTRSNRDRIVEDVAKLVSERKQLASEIRALREGAALSELRSTPLTEAGDLKLLSRTISGFDGRDLKDLAKRALGETQADVVCLLGDQGSTPRSVVVGVRKALAKEHPAKVLLQTVLDPLGGGSGGGSPELAQGAAKGQGDAETAFTALRDALR